jgi:hypothetical protein
MPPLQRQSSRIRELQRGRPERSAPAPGTIGAGAENDQGQCLESDHAKGPRGSARDQVATWTSTLRPTINAEIAEQANKQE